VEPYCSWFSNQLLRSVCAQDRTFLQALPELADDHRTFAEGCTSCATWFRPISAYPKGLFAARWIGRNVSSPTLTESSWALRLRSPHMSSLRDFSLASMWSAQGPDSRWLRKAPGILEHMFQSDACLCGLYKEVGVATLNNSCTVRATAAIPDRNLTVVLICVQLKPSPLITYAVCGNTENSVLPLKKVYSSVSCYLRFDIQIVGISLISFIQYLSAVHLNASILVRTKRTSHNMQIQAATEAQRMLQTLRGPWHFIGLYFWNEATLTTRGIIWDLRSSGLLRSE
jgi:hypothetical protein